MQTKSIISNEVIEFVLSSCIWMIFFLLQRKKFFQDDEAKKKFMIIYFSFTVWKV